MVDLILKHDKQIQNAMIKYEKNREWRGKGRKTLLIEQMKKKCGFYVTKKREKKRRWIKKDEEKEQK